MGDVNQIVSLTIVAPAGVLVGDSAQLEAVATFSRGELQHQAPASWRSSDPTAISVNSQGWIKGLVGGRQATITAEFSGKSASVTVAVNPYAPTPELSRNSSGDLSRRG